MDVATAELSHTTEHNSPDFIVTPFTILRDSREKSPWGFHGFRTDKSGPVAQRDKLIVPRCEYRTLATGDYSLDGLEDRIAIERKSLEDLYGTIANNYRERGKQAGKKGLSEDDHTGPFDRELERLSKLEFAAVIVEVGLGEALQRPPEHTRLKPKTVFRQILAWQQRHPQVQWQFCDGVNGRRLAEMVAFRHLERFWGQVEKENEIEREGRNER